ncbi:hypothetical protein [Hyphomicrobium denitrificans]|uniref:hypothetical protein n=1 Tax=Hyphomicrobium denitrificans TaxID=53399 RepID=UPI0009DAEAA3
MLGTALKTGFRAFLAGVGVTAVLQSGTATELMTAGFAASGLVEPAPIRVKGRWGVRQPPSAGGPLYRRTAPG